MALVYCATNKVNGKKYIGITAHSLKRRIDGHLSRARSVDGTKFHHAIKKYGPENFQWVILCEGISFEEAKIKEQEYIKSYNSCFLISDGHGYNTTLGGDGTLGVPLSQKGIENRRTFLSDREKSAHVRKAQLEALSIPVINHLGQVFSSAAEAARVLGVFNTGIRKCVSGEAGQSKGYGWKNYEGKVEYWDVARKTGGRRKVKRSDGVFFSSLVEAAKFHGGNASAPIFDAIKYKKKQYGFFWEYV